VGTEPVDPGIADRRLQVEDFCRAIEVYLCRKNDGHLIRVVGPSFELVSGWAKQGVPLKVAFEGIDRYFERYYRKGPRRRPVKVDFCEADVLDVFDEWRRATGISRQVQVESRPAGASRQSLPEHIERVVTRLTSARASGAIGAASDPLIDRVAALLDEARAKSGGVRGDARSEMIARLTEIDADLMRLSRAAVDAATMTEIEKDAESELAPFRSGMAPEAHGRAHEAAVDRLVRVRLGLPTVAYDGR